MKDYRAEESRIYGILGVVGMISCGLMIWQTVSPKLSGLISLILWLYFLWVNAKNAWYGLQAVHIAIRGDDLLVMSRKGDLMRIPLEEVQSVRSGTTVYGLRMMTVHHATANTFSTLMRENDLPDLVSRMPRRAIPESLQWAIMENRVPLAKWPGSEALPTSPP